MGGAPLVVATGQVLGGSGSCTILTVQDLLFDRVAQLLRRLAPLGGRGRLALLLHKRATTRSEPWTFQMGRGHHMTVPGNSAQSWLAAFTGSYDDEQIELLLPLIEPGSWVLDVGASLGFYTIPLGLAARAAGARLVAVEPVRQNCVVIRHNVELNGLQDTVTVISSALGAAASEMTVHIESGGAGNAAIVTGLAPEEVQRHDRAGNTWDADTVQVQRLDDLRLPPEVSGRRCSLIKIDVEGFEMDMLEGASDFIAAHRPTIFGEFNPLWLETRGFAKSAPGIWAASNQYVCLELAHHRQRSISDERMSTLKPLLPSGSRSGTDLLLLPVSVTAHSHG